MSDEKPEREESGEQSEENGERSENEANSRDGTAKESLAESIMSDFVNKENSGDGGGSQRSGNSKSGSSRSGAKESGSAKGSGRSGSEATEKSKHSEKSESSSEKEEHHSEKSEKEEHHSEKSEKEEHHSEKSEKEEHHSEKSEKEEHHSEKSEKEEHHSEKSEKEEHHSEKSEKEEHHSEKSESASEKEEQHSAKSESVSEKGERRSEKHEPASEKEERQSEKSEKEEHQSEKHESSSEKEEQHSEKSESSSGKGRQHSEKHDSEGSDEREYGTETDGRRSEAQDYDEETSESRQDRQREEEEERRRWEEEERVRQEEAERRRQQEEEEAERRRQQEEEEEEDRRREAQRREEERLKQIRERQIERQKLDLALTRMLKRKILPDYEIIADVINYAKQKSEQMIQQEDYDTAGEIDVAIDVMFTHMEQERAIRGDTPEARALRQRLNTCKGAEKSIERKYEMLQEQVKEDARQKMAELEAYHQEEQDIFRENWSRPEAKIPFSKPSAELIEMRKQQQVRAYLHDFKTAKAIQQEAKSLEEKEAAAGAKRFESALKTAYQQLVQRQQREVQCLIENVELQLTNLERMKEKELSTNNTTQKNLEMRLTMKQPPKRGGGLPQIKSRGGISKAPSNSTVAIAHRTRMRMPPGLRAPDMMRLELKTNDVRKILEGSKRSSRAPSSMQKTV